MKPINTGILEAWSNGDGDMFEDAKECVNHGCNNAQKNFRCDPTIPCIVNQEADVFVTMMDILEDDDEHRDT